MEKIILLISLVFLALGATMWSSNSSVLNQVIGLIFIVIGGYLIKYSNKRGD